MGDKEGEGAREGDGRMGMDGWGWMDGDGCMYVIPVEAAGSGHAVVAYGSGHWENGSVASGLEFRRESSQ